MDTTIEIIRLAEHADHGGFTYEVEVASYEDEIVEVAVSQPGGVWVIFEGHATRAVRHLTDNDGNDVGLVEADDDQTLEAAEAAIFDVIRPLQNAGLLEPAIQQFCWGE